MIADKRLTKEVGMERTINGRKIPSGTWLLEKLGLCNCCPKARCVFILIEARTLLGLSSRLLHVSDFLTDTHWMHEGFSLLLISATAHWELTDARLNVYILVIVDPNLYSS